VQAGRGAALVRATRIWAALIALAVIGFDQLTKLLVVRAVDEGESKPVIDGVLWLSHFRNSGAAFGMLRGFSGILALAALVGVVIFAAIVVREPSRWTALGAALVAGGATGNLLDRFFRSGGVVDFVDFHFWPAFNVADSAISVGAVLLFLTGVKERKDEPASE
jgi:signal peptidase II